MHERYLKNLGSFIYEDNQEIILTKKIAVIGCGGNGQYIVDFLSRFGVQELSIWDGDNFELSNINRQPYCNMFNIGHNKVIEASKKLNMVNKEIKYNIYSYYFTKDDLPLLLQHDLIIAAADGSYNIIEIRNCLQIAIENNIPVIDAGLTTYGGYV